MRPIIHCILFDMDNTLIEIPDTHSYFDGLIQEVIAKDFHLPMPSVESRDQLWRTGDDFIQVLKSWGIESYKQFWHFFDKRDVIGRKKLMQDGKMQLYPDVLHFLEKMKKKSVSMAIVTNTPKFIAEPELQEFNIIRFFDYIAGLGDIQELCKPNPEGILQVLNHLGYRASETIFIGDSVVDALAAARARIHPILIRRKKKIPKFPKELDEKSVLFLDNLTDIHDYFQIIGKQEIINEQSN
ncbi:MAG: HAD family hydrolase [Candidatus Lokiarchaeota archaeon]|nr:HAD family hydrolase [Candidatus Harpocratesius repetitus]